MSVLMVGFAPPASCSRLCLSPLRPLYTLSQQGKDKTSGNPSKGYFEFWIKRICLTLKHQSTMKPPKKLLQFAATQELEIAEIRFKSHGETELGWELIKPAALENCTPAVKGEQRGYIMVTFEPSNYADTKWKVSQNGYGLSYAKNIITAIKGLELPLRMYHANVYSSYDPWIPNSFK